MGNFWAKEPVNKRTGMTRSENKLVQTTWNTFCRKHPDFGSLLLLAMFTQHPEYQKLFPKFKGRELRVLRDGAKFRAFGQAVGHQLTAIVNSLDDYEDLLAVARQNAVEHARREGVQADHFEGFFSAALSQMIEGNRSAMKPAAITAWEKFFETLNMITKHAFDEAAKEAEQSKRAEGFKSGPQLLPPSSPRNPASTAASGQSKSRHPEGPEHQQPVGHKERHQGCPLRAAVVLEERKQGQARQEVSMTALLSFLMAPA
ncbi:hypothetical protein MTO96_044045 [Rhipicephalus appendiculatus]